MNVTRGTLVLTFTETKRAAIDVIREILRRAPEPGQLHLLSAELRRRMPAAAGDAKLSVALDDAIKHVLNK